jgi:hypothetical protein
VSLQQLQGQLSSLQGRYIALAASKETTPSPTPPPTLTKLYEPPPSKENEPEDQEFEGRTWKWCDKCFGGVWNRTHVTLEHQKGRGHQKQRQYPPDSSSSSVAPPPQANLAETTPTPVPQANIAQNTNYELDFM